MILDYVINFWTLRMYCWNNFKSRWLPYILKQLNMFVSSSPVVFPYLIFDYQLLMNIKTSMLFPAGSIATSKIEERIILGLWGLSERDKAGKEFFVPAMQMSCNHEWISLTQIKTRVHMRKYLGVSHMMPGQPVLTVSHIMNGKSNAHCQDNQGDKGDEANNPGLQTSSLPVLHHSWPEKESK